MYKILTLNNISPVGLDKLPRETYEVASEIQHPDAVLLRSYNMHSWDIPDTLKAVGRAGAGTNNIPIAEMSKRGIPVFNAPGANANAVKELVLGCMLIASRNICQAWDYARNLEGTDEEISKKVEAGKKQYVGFELPNRTLGVIGLGAIGVQIANSARALGMRVVGFDPQITVSSAWQLSSDVEKMNSVDELLSQADFVTMHVPLIDATRNLINADRIRRMKKGVTILNFSRFGIVDIDAVHEALNQQHIHYYISDFPNNLLKNHERVISLPHLGASTKEAEDNCAIMVAEQVRDYLEHGIIRNSVNFPEMDIQRSSDFRLLVVSENVPHMIQHISTTLSDAGVNIADMLNRSSKDIACNLIDVDEPIPQDLIDKMKLFEGILAVRVLH